MPHGAPDYSDVKTGALVYRIDDMGELAARLGSTLTYDRRGNVLWFYNFDHGVNGIGQFPGVGDNSIGLAADYWQTAPFSAYITADANAAAQPYIHTRQPVPPLGKVGFQSSIKFSANAHNVTLQLSHWEGDDRYYSYLNLDPDAETLQVFTGNEGTVTLDSDLPDLSTGYYFANIKLVVDLSDHTLVRAMVDSNEYDLSDYTMKKAVGGIAPNLQVMVRLIGNTDGASTIYVDNLIITHNEP